MSVTYSSIVGVSEPEAMLAFFAEQVIRLLPGAEVVGVKAAKEGRRFEAPRVLWNVYQAELRLADGTELRRLFWTKVYFQDADCEDYRHRNRRLLNDRGRSPLDPRGFRILSTLLHGRKSRHSNVFGSSISRKFRASSGMTQTHRMRARSRSMARSSTADAVN